jgi:hypothetical protein
MLGTRGQWSSAARRRLSVAAGGTAAGAVRAGGAAAAETGVAPAPAPAVRGAGQRAAGAAHSAAAGGMTGSMHRLSAGARRWGLRIMPCRRSCSSERGGLTKCEVLVKHGWFLMVVRAWRASQEGAQQSSTLVAVLDR